jgi:hypothetical protein
MTILDAPSVMRVATRWSLATRIAFRFCFTYFAVYVLTTQMMPGMLPLPAIGLPDLGERQPTRSIVSSVATHVFGVTRPLVISGSGSGDKTYDWVHAFTVLVIAVAVTSIWSIAGRRHEEYPRLHAWFRLFARFALGSTMVSYGMVKAIPLQMPYPLLTRLVEPFGHFSPMGVLWYSIGASRPYEIFAGCAELAGGVLLFFPRTATLGALICLADAIQIFTLNMSYDVPVKLFSFHLILLSLFLLAPEARRLVNVLLFNRGAGPSTALPLGGSARAIRIGLAAQAAFGAWIVGMNLYSAREAWTQYGGGAPKSVLYGIWNVERLSIDDVVRSPLVTDYDRWRRVIFDRPTAAAFQRMDDTFAMFGARIDTAQKSIALTRGPTPAARFTYEQPAANRLTLDGELDGHRLHLELQLVDRNSFLLVNRGFHWIQEYPFNR